MGAHLFDFNASHHVPSIAYGETAPARYGNPEWLIFNPVGSTVTTYFQRAMSVVNNGSGIKCTIAWAANATTGSAVWGVSFARYAAGTLITLAPSAIFGGENIGVTAAGGSAYTIQYTVITVPFGDAPILPTEFFRLRLRHLGAHASRTITSAPVFISIAAENVTT